MWTSGERRLKLIDKEISDEAKNKVNTLPNKRRTRVYTPSDHGCYVTVIIIIIIIIISASNSKLSAWNFLNSPPRVILSTKRSYVTRRNWPVYRRSMYSLYRCPFTKPPPLQRLMQARCTWTVKKSIIAWSCFAQRYTNTIIIKHSHTRAHVYVLRGHTRTARRGGGREIA